MFIYGSQGQQGPKKAGKVTFEKVVPADGSKPYTRKIVHIGLREQKWVPQEINPQKYSSLKAIKKLYPDAERIEVYKNKDGSVRYDISNKDDTDFSTSITVKEDVKGSHIEISTLQYPFWITGKYEDGKLVKAEKDAIHFDPEAIE